MQMLPPPVRNYLASGKYTIVAKDLTAKHELHLDQGGILEREIMLLLMGIENPSEFMATLTGEAKIPEPVVKEIMMEINQGIFMPLQEEMRKGVEVLGKKPPQIPPAAPARQPIVAPIPAPATGAGQSTSHFHLENKLPPSPRPAESPAVRPIPPRPSAQVPVAASALNAPVPALSQQTIKPIPAQLPVGAQPSSINVLPTESKPAQQIPVPPRPPVSNIAPLPPKVVLPSAVGANLRPNAQSFSKPMDGSKLLEDHEEPHIELNKNKAPSSSAETPLQQALRTVLPPPRNLPGAMPPPDIMPSSRPAPAASKIPQAPVKPYSADPYREPIEP